MPELPEVETIKKDLLQVVGCSIIGVSLPWSQVVRKPLAEEFCRKLVGQTIKEVRRRGKYLLLPLNAEILILHLKMAGFLLLKPSLKSEPYASAIFHLDNNRYLYFCDPRRFGAIWLVKDEKEVVGKLGPEPLEPDFTLELLSKLLSQHSLPIKALLVDQNIIAGIGNMYADEALFEAGIYPLKKAKDLSKEEVERLHQAIHQVLTTAIGYGGASVDTYRRPDGELGTAHYFFKVAHRGGEPCYNCHTPIERIPLRGRGTYFCPNCQRESEQLALI